MITLFELVGKDEEIAFSPAVWRTRMQLLHKGLAFERTPWHFTDKDAIAASGSKAVPVIKDGDTWVADSFEIARYLDKTYPEKPLFGCEEGEALGRFFHLWGVNTLLFSLFPILAKDVHSMIAEKDQDYFRQTREKALGTTLEAAAEGARKDLSGFHAKLAPMESRLKEGTFLHGDAPGFMDYDAFGPFIWARVVADIDVLPSKGPIPDWVDRMLDLFDGHARKAPTVHGQG